MRPSAHNISGPIRDADDFFLVNLLSGHADILSRDELSAIQNGTHPDRDQLVDKGYWVEPEEEARRYRAAYLDFLSARDSDEVQLFFVPTYLCNFGCSYCYQDQYPAPEGHDPEAVVHAFFRYIDATFPRRSKYITVFGGEPLLPTEDARNTLSLLIHESHKRSLDLAIVTNGFHLADYVPLLSQGRIREVQVTLDGTEHVHDKRRMLKSGKGTFRQVVAGIDTCLDASIDVNLRAVVDRDNMPSLMDLAQFCIDKGWTDNPLWKTQLGRNYELHHCQSARSRLYGRIDMWRDIYALVRQYPDFLRFHRPAFSVARFLFDNEELPSPLFDSCPACKTEWAFDFSGKIYSCTATVGKPGEAIGTFFPEVSLHEKDVESWEQRDVLTIDTCKGCAVQLACGGGCGAVAKNQCGNIHSPDCRPVSELLELGFAMYRPE